MSRKTKTPADRSELREVYMAVVKNWVVSAKDVAEITGQTLNVVNQRLRRLERVDLLASIHVNGERELTWQSYYDIENSDREETLNAASGDFTSKFPLSDAIEADRKHAGATGPRYTEKQLAKGAKLRAKGLSWAKVAAEVGVKAESHFAKAVRATHGEVK